MNMTYNTWCRFYGFSDAPAWAMSLHPQYRRTWAATASTQQRAHAYRSPACLCARQVRFSVAAY